MVSNDDLLYRAKHAYQDRHCLTAVVDICLSPGGRQLQKGEMNYVLCEYTQQKGK